MKDTHVGEISLASYFGLAALAAALVIGGVLLFEAINADAPELGTSGVFSYPHTHTKGVDEMSTGAVPSSQFEHPFHTPLDNITNARIVTGQLIELPHQPVLGDSLPLPFDDPMSTYSLVSDWREAMSVVYEISKPNMYRVLHEQLPDSMDINIDVYWENDTIRALFVQTQELAVLSRYFQSYHEMERQRKEADALTMPVNLELSRLGDFLIEHGLDKPGFSEAANGLTFAVSDSIYNDEPWGSINQNAHEAALVSRTQAARQRIITAILQHCATLDPGLFDPRLYKPTEFPR